MRPCSTINPSFKFSFSYLHNTFVFACAECEICCNDIIEFICGPHQGIVKCSYRTDARLIAHADLRCSIQVHSMTLACLLLLDMSLAALPCRICNIGNVAIIFSPSQLLNMSIAAAFPKVANGQTWTVPKVRLRPDQEFGTLSQVNACSLMALILALLLLFS